MEHWTVKDGVIRLRRQGRLSLQTAKDYGNFELCVDWKIEKKGDSGLYLRGQPQVQIWDSDNSPARRSEDKNTGPAGCGTTRCRRRGEVDGHRSSRGRRSARSR